MRERSENTGGSITMRSAPKDGTRLAMRVLEGVSMELNYYRTLIAVADDCPVERSEVPATRNGKPTLASLQYEMLADRPFVYRQEDVLFESWLRRQEGADAFPESEAAHLRQSSLRRMWRACARPQLAKRPGWGFRFDEEGRAALLAMECEEYRRIAAGKVAGVTVLKALRSRRG